MPSNFTFLPLRLIVLLAFLAPLVFSQNAPLAIASGNSLFERNMLPAQEEHRRRHKRDFGITSIWILAQFVSVVTGSVANDFIASSLWLKIIYCFKVLRHRNFLSGYKQCWNYANRSNEKWRQLLKPHNMEGIIRIMAARLRRNSEVHFKEALLAIQSDFGQLTLTGDQFVRVVNLLQHARLELPSITHHHGAPSPVLGPAWSQLHGPEKDVLIAHLEVLRMLEQDYSPLFALDHPIDPQSAPIRSSIVDIRRTVENNNKLELYLKEDMGTIGEWTRKFLRKMVDKMSKKDEDEGDHYAKKLLLHAQLALHARALEEWHMKNENMVKNNEILEQYSQLSHCIMAKLYNEKSYEGKRPSLAEAQKWAQNRVANLMPELDMNTNMAEITNFIEKFRKIYGKIHVTKCDYINLEELFNKFDWDVDGNELEMYNDDYGTKERQFLTKLSIESRDEFLGKEKKEDADSGEWRDREILMMHARLAALGHIISRDLVAYQPQLDQISLMLDERKLRLHDPGLPSAFLNLGFTLLNNAYGIKNDGNGNLSTGGVVDEMERVLAKMRHKPMERAKTVEEAMRGLGPDGIVLAESRLDERMLGKLLEKAKKLASERKRDEQQNSKTSQDPSGIKIAPGHNLGNRHFQRSRSLLLPAQRRAISEKESSKNALRRRRRKRIVFGDILLGLGTGFLGNWVSDWVDISRTLRDCVWSLLHGATCRLVRASEVRHTQRERAIMDFQEKTYHTLFMKLAEMRGGEQQLEETVKEVEEYLRKSIKSEGMGTATATGLSLDHFLLDLDLFSFRGIRYHINEHLRGGAKSFSKLNILKAMHGLDYISEHRRDKERARILREMSDSEREQYWREMGDADVGHHTGRLSAYLKNELSKKLALMNRGTSSKGNHGQIVKKLRDELVEYRKQKHEVLKPIREIEGAEQEKIKGKKPTTGEGPEVKLDKLRREISENEAEIERRLARNEQLRWLIEQHERLERIKGHIKNTKHKLEQYKEREMNGNDDVRPMSSNEIIDLTRIARLQLLVHETESLIHELDNKFPHQSKTLTFTEFRPTFIRYSKMFGLIRDLDLGKSIGLKKEQLQKLQQPANLLEGIQSVWERGKAFVARNNGKERHAPIRDADEFEQVLEDRLAYGLWAYEQKWAMVRGWPGGGELGRMGERAEAEVKCQLEGMIRRMINGDDEEEGRKEGDEGKKCGKIMKKMVGTLEEEDEEANVGEDTPRDETGREEG